MPLLKKFARAAVIWAARNPFKAVQLAIALSLLGTALVKSRRLDLHALKRAAHALL